MVVMVVEIVGLEVAVVVFFSGSCNGSAGGGVTGCVGGTGGGGGRGGGRSSFGSGSGLLFIKTSFRYTIYNSLHKLLGIPHVYIWNQGSGKMA